MAARPTPALNEDPFNAVMSTLEGQIRALRGKFDGWVQAVETTDTSEAAFKARSEELRAEIARASDACGKMRTALGNVERSRENFPHIDDRELGSRKAYVDRLDAVRLLQPLPLLLCFFSLCFAPFGPPQHQAPGTPNTPPCRRWRTNCGQTFTRLQCRAS